MCGGEKCNCIMITVLLPPQPFGYELRPQIKDSNLTPYTTH